MTDLVLIIRKALENTEVKRTYMVFNDFPNGSCMDASIIAGLLLEAKGWGPFFYTSAENASGKTHSWLENEDLIIDITADQFNIKNQFIVKKQSLTKPYLGFVVKGRSLISEAQFNNADHFMAYRKVERIINS